MSKKVRYAQPLDYDAIKSRLIDDDEFDFDTALSTPEKEAEWIKLAEMNLIPQGLDIGSHKFDEHFRWKEETINGFFGIDNIGKTTAYIFLNSCMAKRHGKKSLLILKENKARIFRYKIMEMYAGNPLYRCSERLKKEAKEFAYDHFDIFDDIPASRLRTENFIDRVDKLLDRENYFRMFIDPYNGIQHVQLPESNYAFLDSLREMAKTYRLGIDISMHISTDKARNHVHKKGDTTHLLFEHSDIAPMPLENQLKIPRRNFVEGGQPIANKLDDIIVFHRYTKHRELRNYTFINVGKIKEEETGGKPTFEYPLWFRKEPGSMYFVDSDGINPLLKQKSEL